MMISRGAIFCDNTPHEGMDGWKEATEVLSLQSGHNLLYNDLNGPKHRVPRTVIEPRRTHLNVEL
jgi:hypothetical protein